MNRLITGCVVCLVALAGCAGLPSQPTPDGSPDDGVTPPYIVFANDDERTYELTVYLTAAPITEFRVGFRNGTSMTVSQNDVPYEAVSIEPAGEILATGQYDVDSGETLYVALEDCTEDTGVWMIYTPAGQSTAFSWIQTTTCAGLTLLEERNPNGGGSYAGGDYSDRVSGPNTVRRTLGGRTGDVTSSFMIGGGDGRAGTRGQGAVLTILYARHALR